MTARTPDAEPLLTPAEVATMFRVDRRRLPAGPRPASSRPSAPWVDTAVTARPRSAHCSREFRSSAARPEVPQHHRFKGCASDPPIR